MTQRFGRILGAFVAVAASLGIVGSSFALAPAAQAASTLEVTFDLGGGSFSYGHKTVVDVMSGDTVNDPTGSPTYDYPQMAGYAFEGWYTDTSYTQKFDFTQPITANTTIYAHFLKIHIVHWELNGGTGYTGEKQVDDMEVVDGTPEQIPTLTEIDHWVKAPVDGDEFLGVDIDGVTYGPGVEYVVTKDVVVKVLWKSQQPATPTASPSSTATSHPSATPSQRTVGTLANSGSDVLPGLAALFLLAGSLMLGYRRLALFSKA
ncbi:MAG: InlB B-repeat-containing protein [Actinomycetaceae bacterium]|nr:InlB B-repeat-containing protein [Actinomycetaceae bacterium]